MSTLLSTLLMLMCMSIGAQVQTASWAAPKASNAPHFPMRSSAAKVWQAFQDEHPNWYVEFNEYTGLPRVAAGPGIPTTSNDPAEAATVFVRSQLEAYGIAHLDVRLHSTHSSKYHYFNFLQYHEGRAVKHSRVKVRMTSDHRIVLFGMEVYPDIEAPTQAKLSPDEAKVAAMHGLPASLKSTASTTTPIVVPQRTPTGLTYHLAYEVKVEAMDGDMPIEAYVATVDALNGSILSKHSLIHHCSPRPPIQFHVKGGVYSNPYVLPDTLALPHIRIRVGNEDFYTDANGVLDTVFNTPVAGELFMEGRYCSLRPYEKPTPSYPITIQSGVQTIALSGLATAEQIAAYYHLTKAHDYMRSILDPGFDDLDGPVTVTLGYPYCSCNAGGGNGHVSFCPERGGCTAAALFAEIAYHEYGHNINQFYYSYAGGSMGNRALNEAYADIWALLITENPVLGMGLTAPDEFTRRYDQHPKVYPNDITGEEHQDGEILAGAWWDTYLNLQQDRDAVAQLFAEVLLGTAMQPDGHEGKLFRDILLDLLLADDTDGDWTNGTPNSAAILTAFERHGITLVSGIDIEHHQPLFATAKSAIDIRVDLDSIPVVFPDSILVRFRTDRTQPYQTLKLDYDGLLQYRVSLPAQDAGTIVDYYFEVFAPFGYRDAVLPEHVDHPSDPAIPYNIIVGMHLAHVEDFDANHGAWVVNPDKTDQATNGVWAFAEPVPEYTSGWSPQFMQPFEDHTPGEGSRAAVTGWERTLPFYRHDVDSGKTTLLSPPFNLSVYPDAVISYWRWFANDDHWLVVNDPLRVQISSNGRHWVTVENTYTEDLNWRRMAFKVRDYVEPNPQVQLRFIAMDTLDESLAYGGISTVEVTIDDLEIWTTGPLGSRDSFELRIYPNPANRIVAMELPVDFEGEVRVLDGVGALVDFEFASLGEKFVAFDVRQWAAGAYVVLARSKFGARWQGRLLVY